MTRVGAALGLAASLVAVAPARARAEGQRGDAGAAGGREAAAAFTDRFVADAKPLKR